MSDEYQMVGPCFSTNICGKGQPLVLIHGFPFDHTMWQAQIDALSPICQVIAPDLRGFGRSPFADTAEYYAAEGVDMKDYSADLAAALESSEINEPVILCGFSMGGYILWQFARQYPERVKALVLCDTRADADSTEASAGRLEMAESVIGTGTEPVVEAMLPKLLAADTVANRPELVEKVASMIRQASPEAIAAAQRGMARRPDMQSELASFNWPALVLAGAEDVISPPAEMRAIAASLPQGKYCEIAAAGHMSPLENPDAFNQALIEFIASL